MPFREAKVLGPGGLSRARGFLRAQNGGVARARARARAGSGKAQGQGEIWGPELTSISSGKAENCGCLVQKG